MDFNIRLSTPDDKAKISEMIHEIYAKELGQYNVNSENSIIDKYDETNNYIVAYLQDELVGMVSITRPNDAKISTLNRVPKDNPIHKSIDDIAEVRLLSIKKTYRKKGLYKLIIFKIMQFCDLHNIDRILISAIENKVDVYALMGFKIISDPIIENSCTYVPMELLRSNFSKSSYYRVLDGLRVYDQQKGNLKALYLSLLTVFKPSTIKFLFRK